MKNFNSVMAKRIVLFAALFCLVAVFSFAADDAFGLNSKVGILVELLNAPWIKGIAFVALVIECVALITTGRQEPQMFKKFIPWIIGTIVFMAAGPITNKFIKLDSNDTLKDLGMDK